MRKEFKPMVQKTISILSPFVSVIALYLLYDKQVDVGIFICVWWTMICVSFSDEMFRKNYFFFGNLSSDDKDDHKKE